MLEPYIYSSIPNPSIPPPPLVQLLDGPEYEVEATLYSKVMRNKLYYLVDWTANSPNDRTWEAAENLNNATGIVADFHHRYSDKPTITTHGTHCQRRG